MVSSDCAVGDVVHFNGLLPIATQVVRPVSTGLTAVILRCHITGVGGAEIPDRPGQIQPIAWSMDPLRLLLCFTMGRLGETMLNVDSAHLLTVAADGTILVT